MCIIINRIESCMDIQDNMTAEGIRGMILVDGHFSALAELILCRWPTTKTEVLIKHFSFLDGRCYAMLLADVIAKFVVEDVKPHGQMLLPIFYQVADVAMFCCSSW